MPATYTVKQVAGILGYSTNSIYTFLKEKRIRGVRVGKGRFRIPQRELDRLLLETGKHTSIQSGQISTPAIDVSGVIQAKRVDEYALPLAVDVPSLLDWFAGVSSILLGFSMLLFSRQYEEFAFAGLGMWVRSIQTTLFTCGAGLLLTDVIGKGKTAWRMVFLTLLAVGFAGTALASFPVGDQMGMWLYGLLSILLCLHLVSPLGPVASFALYAGIALAGLPFLSQVNGDSLLTQMTGRLGMSFYAGAAVWVGICTSVAALLIWGARGKKQAFWVCMTILAGIWVGIALWCTSQLLWGKAMFALVIALVSLFVPTWDTLQFSSKNDRKLVFASFGLILGLFVLATGVIRLLQTNVVSYASEQLENKSQYGKIMLESRIESIQSSLSDVSGDSTFISAVLKEEPDVLQAVMRGIYAGNNNVRRIVTVNAKGTLLAVYPHDTTIQSSNFSNRDFVQKVIASKKPYVADMYESQTLGPPITLLIAVPVFDSESGELASVLAAYIDLIGLSDRIQQIASSELGESITVLNGDGRYLLAADSNLIGMQSPQSHPVRSGLLGKQGNGEWYDEDKNRVLGVYKPLEKAQWVIAVEVPVKNILSVTGAGTVTVFGLVIVSVVIVVFLSVIRRGNPTGVSPPVRGP